MHSTNAFLPLLRAGRAKKIVAITSCVGDPDFILGTGLAWHTQYSISKAALNMAIAEFAVALRSEGFTCLALAPGIVDVFSDAPKRECSFPFGRCQRR